MGKKTNQVKIRRYTGEGSTITEYAIREAQAVARDAWARHCLVVQDSVNEPIPRGTALIEEETYTLVPPIAGGW